MEKTEAGYKEIEHTADWELEAWAPDFPGLLEQAARGMYALSGMRLDAGPRRLQTIQIEASDLESLLVHFLSELLYYAENGGVAFDSFTINWHGQELTARLSGAPLLGVEKEIKAVTYHNLNIQQTGQGLRVRIVFDV
jgi:SHS2 domain-containing protein